MKTDPQNPTQSYTALGNGQGGSGAASDYEVVVIGGGPVGMLLACLLGQRSVRVLVLEMRTGPLEWSQAIGITPPSLEIMARLGLDDEFVARGVPIRDCHVHGETGHLGCASFRELKGRHRYVLSLPQMITMEILEAEAARHPTVTVKRGVEVRAKKQTADRVMLECHDLKHDSTWNVTAGYAVACDGSRSRVRDMLKIRTHSKSYGCHFVMGDFVDGSSLADEAHLFFTSDGAVESFPLPGGKRRWIVQTSQRLEKTEAGFISSVVRRRAGLELDATTQLDQHVFSPRRLDCEALYDGRVLLCGDAAHVMSPIGGQGMNTGFADAEFAAEALYMTLRKDGDTDKLFALYDHHRRRAANAAATRAAWGMGLGVWTGKWPALLRDFVLRHAVFQGPLKRRLGPWFAMQSIPANTLAQLSCPRARQMLGLI